jgi:hypothetical protein
MNVEAIIEQIDALISKLQQAKVLLEGAEVSNVTRRAPGRPKKIALVSRILSVKPTARPAKRMMSAEAKSNIAAAQKLRWAKSKKAAKKATKVVSTEAA